MKTDQSTANGSSVTLGSWGGIVLASVCITAALLLVPGDTEHLERVIADGRIDRLREIAAEEIGYQPDDRQLLEFALSDLGKDGWDERGISAAQQLVAQIEDTPSAYLGVQKFGDELPDRGIAKIYSSLARRSLADGNPALAAEIYKVHAIRTGMSEELTAKLVESLRFSEKPREAYEALAQFKLENAGQMPAALIELHDALALEAGDVETAFDSMRERFDKVKARSRGELRERIDKLIAAGSQAGRSDELITLCDEFLATTEADALTWEDIFERRRLEPEFDDGAYREIAGEAAKFCRWNDQPDKAFDYLRKIAALGNSSALDACVALHKPLLREHEMADLLHRFVPLDTCSDYTLLAAQLHAKRTKYELADAYYQQHLHDHPGDAKIWAERAGMWDAAGQFEKALDAFRESARADPDDTASQLRIARLLVTLGQYDDALEHYSQLDELDPKAVSQYYTLATNLGSATAANDAMVKWFRLPGERRPIDHSRLARSYSAMGKHDKMIQTYRAAIKRNPRDRGLPLDLASELGTLRRHAEVMAVLGDSGLRNDPEAVSLYLQAALARKQYAAGLSYCGSGAEIRHQLPISAKLPLAEIYYQTGAVEESNRLYNSIPASEIPLPTRAALAFRKRDYATAEQLQKRHLNANPNDHSGWSFLGSVYQAQLKKREAREAYQRGLSLLKKRMSRR